MKLENFCFDIEGITNLLFLNLQDCTFKQNVLNMVKKLFYKRENKVFLNVFYLRKVYFNRGTIIHQVHFRFDLLCRPWITQHKMRTNYKHLLCNN